VKEESGSPLQQAILDQAGLVQKERAARTWKTYEVPDSDASSAGVRQVRKQRAAEEFADDFAKHFARDDGDDDGSGELARGLIEKAADELPDVEVAPDDVLRKSHGMLLTAFRKTYGRDPERDDEAFWTAYRGVIRELRAEVARQES